MNRNQKDVYCFIYDDNKHFYRARQTSNGSWIITHNSDMYPITHTPKNLLDCPVEFGTNKRYFSMNRTINYPLEFTFDAAAILNSKYLLGKGANENLYFAMFEFDSVDGIYKLSYNGKFDFQNKKRDEKLATFTVSIIDDSAWGVLSQNDDVEYSIDCSESNPKAIKVLFDNFTLENRYTFQTVQVGVSSFNASNTHTIPFVLVMQDGDSSGLITKSQVSDDTTNYITYVQTSSNYFLSTFYQINNINFQGDFIFNWSTNTLPSGGLKIYFRTSTGQERVIFSQLGGNLIPGHTYKLNINFTINLAPGEKMFFLADLNDNAARHFTITPIVTNIFISTKTKAEPAICYGLRPLDLLKEIVKKGTLERYSIESNFFEVNNKTILLPGDSIRGVRDSKIYTSFRDFFETFSALFFMALRVVNGSLFMELADEVYKQGTNIIDLGEIIECETNPATDYFANEINVGSKNQDYRHPSGRLEYNQENIFSLPFLNVKGKLNWVTKYRTDCYGIIFLMLDYRGLSTRDNSGDKEVFVADITDEQATATSNVETFENINVNNAPLAPIIKYPLTGDIINNDKPFIKGVGIIGTTVNIYIFDVLDGSTAVDGAGNWSYQINTSLPSYNPGVSDGISVINSTNTDMSGAIDTIQLIIDTTVSSATGITYPRVGDSLYNNKPLIRGISTPGTNININLDGVFLATVVTDNSCKWEYKVVTPLTNGNHTLDIGVGTVITFNVSAFTLFPLITYVGSELDGFPITNNLPLIQGVGTPGVIVTIYLNYISYVALGTALIDAKGNWSFQVVPVTYIDPISSLPVTVAPIRNGLNIVSTSLVNNTVQINVTGYKLNRPNYTSITGVPDNTVFNTRLTPMHQMLNHKSLLSAMMNMQRNDAIHFEKAGKNSNLRTVLGTQVVTERSDIQVSSLGAPIAILEEANIKVIAKKNFAQTLYDFNNGGTIKGTFKGKNLFFLPIGSMKMKSIMDDVQEWKLLISPLTSYTTLLNLYKSGLTINLMQNAIFHSDYNSLHMVEYDYTQPDQYNFKSIYSDWFMNRNEQWLYQPTYIQKFQKTETIRDQIITNGISEMTLKMYRCSDTALIDTFIYNPVANPPIPIPEIVLEAVIPLNNYPPDQYFFVAYVGETVVYISERIETRVKWLNTILIESTNSVNKPGVFYSTGFKTIIRVEGLVKKIQPLVDLVVAKEESGDTKTLYSNIAKKRIIRFGKASGIPDYLSMKIADALTNDGCSIEGTLYTLEEGEKINPSEDISGVPMYYYDVMLTLQENSKGKVFPGVGGSDVTGVIVVVDASAIGLPAHSIINIDEQ